MRDDAAIRIEVSLRAARIAKCALDLMNLDPMIVPLQLVEVVKEVRQLDDMLKRHELQRLNAQVTI
jgi:hypothetical protein